jgi:hypothetical protein
MMTARDAAPGGPQPGDYPCRSAKRQYATKADARGHRRSLNALRGNGRVESYRCGYCGFWHVGRR